MTMAREVVASQLVWNCLTAKESKYANEREIRCIIMGVRDKFDADRQVQEGTGHLYIETPMALKEAGSIAEIMVGPLAPPGTETTVTEFLRAQGYSGSIPVKRSAIVF